MSPDFFNRLETDLGNITHAGMHLATAAHGRRRVIMLVRRAAVIVALATALAASLDGEFPASASGHAQAAQILEVQGA